jgi:hypothetical protein
MATNRLDTQRRRLFFLLLSAVLALCLALLGAYLVVVSENSASAVKGPATVYGPGPSS